MLLTITSTHQPATDLGYLLVKNPARAQTFELNVGKAHVFYPEASDERCTAALLLDIDPIDLVRGRGNAEGLLSHYINDRPYVASSFMSVALAEVFGSALNGRCRDKPELVDTPLPLEIKLAALPAYGGEEIVRRLFEPLGYEVELQNYPLDPNFPAWGQSAVVSLGLRARITLREALNHLYVLIPVLDRQKHYYINEEEIQKLMRRGEGWLSQHPERNLITRRYLKRDQLVRQALAQLLAEEAPEELIAKQDEEEPAIQEAAKQKQSLHSQRLQAVHAELRACSAQSVLDLGCGEGRLLTLLLPDMQFIKISGMDVSYRSLEVAQRRLKLDRQPPAIAARLSLFQGSLLYRDARLSGFDAAAVVEVIEHLEPDRLAAFERVLFEFAQPKHVILTTPNREYNQRYENLTEGKLRHGDHRFEWTRAEFQAWADQICERFGYKVRISGVGEPDPEVGSSSQMAVFSLNLS
jgi:3' terminal RNA ribose 2'-O-methyltransferase Hen1